MSQPNVFLACGALLLGLAGCSSPSASPAPCPAPSAAGAAGAGCDADRDGHLSPACGGLDCDDARPDIHPDATDTCDGDDNDCDGDIDELDACQCADPPSNPDLPFASRVCLRGGWFLRGMGESDPDAVAFGYSVSPVRPVFVSPFFMDQYEVTNERYLACVQEGKCWLEPSVLGEVFDIEEHSTEEERHRPFTWLNIWIADNFCKAQGGRLPSEAEWERAAAGLGDRPRPYPSGEDLPTCEEEVTGECFPGVEWPKPTRVGTKPPNPEGLFDLGGNVYELTREPSRLTSYSECKDPCKNPCVLCQVPLPPRSTSLFDSEIGTNLFIARGGSAGLDPTKVIIVNSQKIKMDHFFRSQGRHQVNLDLTNSYHVEGFRCVYPAKPVR